MQQTNQNVFVKLVQAAMAANDSKLYMDSQFISDYTLFPTCATVILHISIHYSLL